MEWIIICNPKDYDIKSALNKLNRINWRQNNNIEINDFVYIYVGSPVGALKYKCIVNKVNLELPEINDDQFVLNSEEIGHHDRYMELEKLEEYNSPHLGRDQLMKNGLKTLQGSSRVSEALHQYIAEHANDVKRHVYIEAKDETLQMQIDDFDKHVHEGEKELSDRVKQFVDDYTVPKLKMLKKEDYVYGLGNKDSYCYRVTHDLQEWGSIQNGTPNKYGVYYDPHKQKYCKVS